MGYFDRFCKGLPSQRGTALTLQVFSLLVFLQLQWYLVLQSLEVPIIQNWKKTQSDKTKQSKTKHQFHFGQVSPWMNLIPTSTRT